MCFLTTGEMVQVTCSAESFPRVLWIVTDIFGGQVGDSRFQGEGGADGGSPAGWIVVENPLVCVSTIDLVVRCDIFLRIAW